MMIQEVNPTGKGYKDIVTTETPVHGQAPIVANPDVILNIDAAGNKKLEQIMKSSDKNQDEEDSNDDSLFHGEAPQLEDIKDTSSDVMKRLVTVSIITTIFMVAQAIGGFLADSIAILLDSAHMLTDLSAFLIAIFALCITKRKANHVMSYGYIRSEVIGNLLAILLLWGLTIGLVVEAVERVINPPDDIDALIMMITAFGGLGFNIIMGVVLHAGGDHHGHSHAGHDHGHGHGHSHGHSHSHGSSANTKKAITEGERKKEHNHAHEHKHDHDHDHPHGHDHKHDHDHDHDHGSHSGHNHHHHKEKATGQIEIAATPAESKKNEKKEKKGMSQISESDNMNLRSAMIHVIGDGLNSVGVCIAAVIIYCVPGSQIADPICTFIFSVFVIITTLPNLKDSLRVLMEGAPPGFEQDFFEKFRARLQKLPNVVEIHDLHIWALSVGKPVMSAHILSSNPAKTLREATALSRRLGIFHSTIQVEGTQDGDDATALIDCKHNIHN